MNQDCRKLETELSGRPNSDSDALQYALDLGFEGHERELRLYARYVRALALLCECAPFVDDENYTDLVDELLVDACKHYPLEWRREGDRREIALRSPVPE